MSFVNEHSFFKIIKLFIDKKVLTVEAIDPDQNADLEYQIIDVRAIHKSGTPVTETHIYDFTKAFM